MRFYLVANWNTQRQRCRTGAARHISGARRASFCASLGAAKSWRTLRAGERNQRREDAQQVRAQQLATLRDPAPLSDNYTLYRQYIRRSKAEFTVAKDQYVRLNTGWFSDRSACYLAAGRPVITQETGFTKHYGGEAGLFAFSFTGEVAEAVKMINADYAKHSRAARAIAREFFDAEKVLRSLLDRAGI